MSDIKDKLTRKVGPLPVWVWILVIFVGVWWYRNHTSSSSSTTNNTGTPTDTTTATTPQPITTLEPGESAYDPNTGGLLTAPGSGNTGSGGTEPPTPGSPVPSVPTSPSGNNGDSGPAVPPTVTVNIPGIKALTNALNRQNKKRGIKPKAAHNPPKNKPTTKAPKPNSKSRPRSSAVLRTVGRGVSGITVAGKATTRRPTPASRNDVKAASSVGTRVRQRPQVPLTRDNAPTQRKEATHPKASTRTVVENPPRPSAPPPRNANRAGRKK